MEGPGTEHVEHPLQEETLFILLFLFISPIPIPGKDQLMLRDHEDMYILSLCELN